MSKQSFREQLRRELPELLQQDSSLRTLLVEVVRPYVAGKAETDSRFDRLLAEIRHQQEEWTRRWDEKLEEDRRKWEENERRWEEWTRRWDEKLEEDRRKWEENGRRWEEWTRRWDEKLEEDRRKWEENERRWEELQQERKQAWEENQRRWQELQRERKQAWEEWTRRWDEKLEEDRRKWEENQKVIEGLLQEIRDLRSRYDQGIGALGARWGLQAEEAFRAGVAAILKAVAPDVEVLHVVEKDEKGEVFGYPEHVELDLIVKDGVLILAEIKSSVDKGDVYTFERKVRFYEKQHGRKADRLMIISPMVDSKARKAAEKLGIEVYSYAEEAAENL